jgi:S1-C subfamily serine protease
MALSKCALPRSLNPAAGLLGRLRRRLLFVGVAAAALAAGGNIQAQAGPSTMQPCYLQRGTMTAQGNCRFEQLGGGDFNISMRVTGPGAGRWYAAVRVQIKRQLAQGYWGTRRQPIGDLHANGACWENEPHRVRICAWGRGEQPVLPVAIWDQAPPAYQPPVYAQPAPVTPAPAPVVNATPTPVKPAQPPKESSGTGFFVSDQGYVLTNAHVINGCTIVQVPGPNGLTSARLVAKDISNDLALLKTELKPPKVAQLRTDIRLGESVAAFGYPLIGVLSSTGNFTIGNVTSLTGLRDDTRYLQISTPVQPGNSGGPLLDGSGNFVGVVSGKLDALLIMVATEGDIPQNVNFAIKSSVAATFLQSNGVTFLTGALGATIPPADIADQAKAMSLPVLCK